jgi:hypothetical protein
MAVKLHAFQISVLDAGEWPASFSVALLLEKEPLVPFQLEARWSPRAHVHDGKEKNPHIHGNQSPSHY